jgi:hypothetical protein
MKLCPLQETGDPSFLSQDQKDKYRYVFTPM